MKNGKYRRRKMGADNGNGNLERVNGVEAFTLAIRKVPPSRLLEMLGYDRPGCMAVAAAREYEASPKNPGRPS